jgi:hypothetical protein
MAQVTLKRAPIGRGVATVVGADGKTKNIEVPFQGFDTDKELPTLDEVLSACGNDESLLIRCAVDGFNEYSFQLAADPFAKYLGGLTSEQSDIVKSIARDFVKNGLSHEKAVAAVKATMGY